jgi:hypothetical protein
MPDPTTSDLIGWGVPLEIALCPHCDWRYLVPGRALPTRCPHCFREELVALDAEDAQLPYACAPELVVPFSVDTGTVERRIAAFAKGIPFAPRDLDPDTLRHRLRRLYVPQWLVDSDVTATWQAEVGFDYQVVSHQERYSDGVGWLTKALEETRVRWEPRAGRLARHYDNVVVGAFEDQASLEREVGAYRHDDAQPYGPSAAASALVRLPDREPEDAWSAARPGFRTAAQDECREAARADHIRQFRWAPGYAGQTWTLLLQPLYTTYYVDDDGEPQPVLINAQTGHLSGRRRASMQRAQRLALILAAVAIALFVVSVLIGLVGLLLPPLFVVAALGAFLALCGGVGALFPLVRAWRFNRQEGWHT